MITGAIIDLFGRVLFFFIDLLPSAGTFPSQIQNAVHAVFVYAFGWNWLLPISTAVTILSLAGVFYGTLWLVHAIKWLLNILRGAGA